MPHEADVVVPDLFELRLRLDADLTALGGRVKMLSRDLKNQGTKRGEKPKKLEHELLSDVTYLLEDRGRSVTEAAAQAARIIKKAGIGFITTEGTKPRQYVNEWRDSVKRQD